VVLQALGPAAHDGQAHAAWATRVHALCAALHWPAPEPVVQAHAQGATLAFAAPEDALLTATEINEWAWERSSPADGSWVPLQPANDDLQALTAQFSRRAADELSRPVQQLRAAARGRGLPVFEDDDSLSIGAGSGSRTWPRAALPLPMDVPWAALHDVPTVLISGSNGKTTCTRLLAAMAQAAGRQAGYSSTEGVWVGGLQASAGDYAGPAGARAVLRHAGVDFAVLETARGGILRRGLAVVRADVAVVTNISADHLGEYGIDNVQDIAAAKLALAHPVGTRGTLVLNGADAVLMQGAARVGAVKALFAAEHDHPALAAHRAHGGTTCGVANGQLLLHAGGTANDLGAVAGMPLTLGGAAAFNIDNIAACVLAGHATGLPLNAMRSVLQRFGSTALDNPGRLERWPWRGATVLLDYAHNPDGLAQLLSVARALKPQRLGLLLGQAGNRDDAAIAELARVAAGFQPGRVVVKELPGMLRGRAVGELPALIESTLLAAGLSAHQVQHHADELEAAQALLAWAEAGDVLVLPIHTAAVRTALAQVLSRG
jgi:UDP-N-acetylmuramyl tripeptide synthase